MSDGFDISNNIISGKVDDVTMTFSDTGDFIVKDGGIDTAQLADDAVTTAKIASPTGIDTDVVTGTASATPDNLVKWDANGDAVDAGETITEIKADSQTAAETYADTAATTAAEAAAMQFSGTDIGPISTDGTWKELDVGATLGAGRYFVMLEISGGNALAQMLLRAKGSSIDSYGSTSVAGWGCSGGSTTSSDGFIATLITDADGVVEYKASTSTGISVTLLAYQVLQS